MAEIQNGILEMMKTIFSMGEGSQDLNLDRPTAEGGYFVLQLLQATLIEPSGLEFSLATTNPGKSAGNQVE